ncbi:hypothetical protein BpHYR1_023964 [Brachionus plicatilis]|uniref:Uncharacterized protein n=1 Tax=Brachionus plicatilis TaxID=10195 RepID=A0A3M7SQ92_BRAPC|nr:hypothetical protein BpHYR1_023964 [Brachionus plicatilis]
MALRQEFDLEDNFFNCYVMKNHHYNIIYPFRHIKSANSHSFSSSQAYHGCHNRLNYGKHACGDVVLGRHLW